MALSNDLISQFVKATRDNTPKRKETTVYGTTVALNGKTYVKIDGSDLMTPVITTTDIKAGQRVAVMIKDHCAMVTGNVSSPSVNKDTTDELSGQIGNLQGDIKDKVTTGQLNAQVAIIEELIAGKAEIGELNALKAQIKDLNVDNLTAHLAQIDKLIAGKADIVDLDAVHARIDVLQADVGNIQTLIGGNLTMDNIQSLVLTSSKVTVDNAFIKDAMIDRISANKLTAGKINTNLVEIGSDDGSMTMTGSLQQFRDKAGKVRIQIGKDATGDFTFALFGADGKGQLINQNGIQPSGIGNGLIVDDMVNSNANIAGSKLDIGSVVTEINGSTSTISSSKVQFDDKKQTLDVVFNNMQTEVDKIPTLEGTTSELVNTTQTHTTQLKTQKGQIETLISDTTLITQDGQPIKMKDDYSQFKITVGEFSNKIGSLETNYGKTLKMTKTEYYVSLSAINLVGGTWSETTPNWSKGKFIWQRLVYYYNDGSIVRGAEVCIQGAAGEDGKPGTDGRPGTDGTDGVGISRIEEYYQVSDSGSVAPTSWVTSPPPMTTTNKYLWNYEKMIFTNNTFKETEKRVIGVHGQNGTSGTDGKPGVDGVGIKFITNRYLATSLATGVTTETSGWTTTVQSMSPTKKYLWSYETILYTNGKSTSTTPCIIGVYGDKGEAGIDGIGIAKITEYYQVSKFNNAPPDTWLTTVPPMTEINKYLWNYEKIDYSNGTSKETAKRVIGVHGQNGANGQNGSNGVGIGEIKNFYLLTNSATGITHSTSGWTETVQNVSASKKYLWNYEQIKYTNGNIYKTTPCIIGTYGRDGVDGQDGIDGKPGVDGKPGKDGVGISKVEEFYQVSTSNTSAPTSWVTTPPQMTTTNKYLWNYEKVTYTDGTFKETAKRVIGVHGQNGVNGQDGRPGTDGKPGTNGVGIRSVTNRYLASSQATGVTTSTGGWTTEIQTISPSKKYLWNYETVTYTDGKTQSTTPCIIGTYGRDGVDGKPGVNGQDGIGITKIEEFYQVSTSNTTLPGSWVSTPPQMTSTNRYLWNYEKITYSNGTYKETAKRVIGVYGDRGQNGADGTDGKPGVDGKPGTNGVGIKVITNRYLASSQATGVTTSTGGWTTTIQSMSPTKKYLWNYETITYTDGKTQDTVPCIIGTYGRDGVDGQDGRPGQDGAPGKDGVGIAKIEEFYQVSPSNSTIPSTWVTTPPQLTVTNKYMWNYEKVTYTDNTAKETAKRVIGVYGDKGQNGTDGKPGVDGKPGTNGVGIKSITNKYLVSPNASGITTSTSGWTTSIPTLSNTNKYLWNYETVLYTDGKSVNTVPCIIGVYGDKGQNGQDGRPGTDGKPGQSVNNVIPQYFAHTSSTTKPADGVAWSDTCPTYTRGRYLWVRNKIIFSNPSETKYTYPYYEPSWDAKATADDAKNTVTSKVNEFKQTLDGFKTKVESTEAKVNNSKYGLINYVLKSDQTLEATPVESSWSNDRLFLDPDEEFLTESLGRQCTYSIEVYSKGAVSIPEEGSKWCRLGGELCINFEDGTNAYLGGVWKTPDRTSWKYLDGRDRYYTTFTMPNKPIKNIEVRMLVQGLKAGKVTTSRPMLTIGNIQTDYQVNIKDIMNHIDDASKMTNGQGQLVYIKDQLTQTETTVNGIKNSVSSLESHFDDDGTVTQMNKQMTEFQQLANKFTMDFWTKFQESHDGVTQLHDYIHFTPDGITIGQENYPVKLMLTKDRIKFVNTDGAQLAYFSDGKLFVNDAEILATMKIANYAFLPTSGGSLTIAAIR